ncbi:hypothetical protein ADUPG1_013852 [Aduncisulcus paluster]|uniref:Uncharacterized protein n=1 Tax=Aduncisulcus paluster TaxID=2918883 RepID=A0ABQ5K9A5_9EUKA|nr:hypothetical protein ADUPG1_013852 [Aduncisulcus paluster]
MPHSTNYILIDPCGNSFILSSFIWLDYVFIMSIDPVSGELIYKGIPGHDKFNTIPEAHIALKNRLGIPNSEHTDINNYYKIYKVGPFVAYLRTGYHVIIGAAEDKTSKTVFQLPQNHIIRQLTQIRWIKLPLPLSTFIHAKSIPFIDCIRKSTINSILPDIDDIFSNEYIENALRSCSSSLCNCSRVCALFCETMDVSWLISGKSLSQSTKTVPSTCSSTPFITVNVPAYPTSLCPPNSSFLSPSPFHLNHTLSLPFSHIPGACVSVCDALCVAKRFVWSEKEYVIGCISARWKQSYQKEEEEEDEKITHNESLQISDSTHGSTGRRSSSVSASVDHQSGGFKSGTNTGQVPDSLPKAPRSKRSHANSEMGVSSTTRISSTAGSTKSLGSETSSSIHSSAYSSSSTSSVLSHAAKIGAQSNPSPKIIENRIYSDFETCIIIFDRPGDGSLDWCKVRSSVFDVKSHYLEDYKCLNSPFTLKSDDTKLLSSSYTSEADGEGEGKMFTVNGSLDWCKVRSSVFDVKSHYLEDYKCLNSPFTLKSDDTKLLSSSYTSEADGEGEGKMFTVSSASRSSSITDISSDTGQQSLSDSVMYSDDNLRAWIREIFASTSPNGAVHEERMPGDSAPFNPLVSVISFISSNAQTSFFDPSSVTSFTEIGNNSDSHGGDEDSQVSLSLAISSSGVTSTDYQNTMIVDSVEGLCSGIRGGSIPTQTFPSIKLSADEPEKVIVSQSDSKIRSSFEHEKTESVSIEERSTDGTYWNQRTRDRNLEFNFSMYLRSILGEYENGSYSHVFSSLSSFSFVPHPRTHFIIPKIDDSLPKKTISSSSLNHFHLMAPIIAIFRCMCYGVCEFAQRESMCDLISKLYTPKGRAKSFIDEFVSSLRHQNIRVALTSINKHYLSLLESINDSYPSLSLSSNPLSFCIEYISSILDTDSPLLSLPLSFFTLTHSIVNHIIETLSTVYLFLSFSSSVHSPNTRMLGAFIHSIHSHVEKAKETWGELLILSNHVLSWVSELGSDSPTVKLDSSEGVGKLKEKVEEEREKSGLESIGDTEHSEDISRSSIQMLTKECIELCSMFRSLINTFSHSASLPSFPPILSDDNPMYLAQSRLQERDLKYIGTSRMTLPYPWGINAVKIVPFPSRIHKNKHDSWQEDSIHQKPPLLFLLSPSSSLLLPLLGHFPASKLPQLLKSSSPSSSPLDVCLAPLISCCGHFQPSVCECEKCAHCLEAIAVHLSECEIWESYEGKGNNVREMRSPTWKRRKTDHKPTTSGPKNTKRKHDTVDLPDSHKVDILSSFSKDGFLLAAMRIFSLFSFFNPHVLRSIDLSHSIHPSIKFCSYYDLSISLDSLSECKYLYIPHLVPTHPLIPQERTSDEEIIEVSSSIFPLVSNSVTNPQLLSAQTHKDLSNSHTHFPTKTDVSDKYYEKIHDMDHKHCLGFTSCVSSQTLKSIMIPLAPSSVQICSGVRERVQEGLMVKEHRHIRDVKKIARKQSKRKKWEEEEISKGNLPASVASLSEEHSSHTPQYLSSFFEKHSLAKAKEEMVRQRSLFTFPQSLGDMRPSDRCVGRVKFGIREEGKLMKIVDMYAVLLCIPIIRGTPNNDRCSCTNGIYIPHASKCLTIRYNFASEDIPDNASLFIGKPFVLGHRIIGGAGTDWYRKMTGKASVLSIPTHKMDKIGDEVDKTMIPRLFSYSSLPNLLQSFSPASLLSSFSRHETCITYLRRLRAAQKRESSSIEDIVDMYAVLLCIPIIRGTPNNDRCSCTNGIYIPHASKCLTIRYNFASEDIPDNASLFIGKPFVLGHRIIGGAGTDWYRKMTGKASVLSIPTHKMDKIGDEVDKTMIPRLFSYSSLPNLLQSFSPASLLSSFSRHETCITYLRRLRAAQKRESSSIEDIVDDFQHEHGEEERESEEPSDSEKKKLGAIDEEEREQIEDEVILSGSEKDVKDRITSKSDLIPAKSYSLPELLPSPLPASSSLSLTATICALLRVPPEHHSSETISMHTFGILSLTHICAALPVFWKQIAKFMLHASGVCLDVWEKKEQKKKEMRKKKNKPSLAPSSRPPILFQSFYSVILMIIHLAQTHALKNNEIRAVCQSLGVDSNIFDELNKRLRIGRKKSLKDRRLVTHTDKSQIISENQRKDLNMDTSSTSSMLSKDDIELLIPYITQHDLVPADIIKFQPVHNQRADCIHCGVKRKANEWVVCGRCGRVQCSTCEEAERKECEERKLDRLSSPPHRTSSDASKDVSCDSPSSSSSRSDLIDFSKVGMTLSSVLVPSYSQSCAKCQLKHRNQAAQLISIQRNNQMFSIIELLMVLCVSCRQYVPQLAGISLSSPFSALLALFESFFSSPMLHNEREYHAPPRTRKSEDSIPKLCKIDDIVDITHIYTINIGSLGDSIPRTQRIKVHCADIRGNECDCFVDNTGLETFLSHIPSCPKSSSHVVVQVKCNCVLRSLWFSVENDEMELEKGVYIWNSEKELIKLSPMSSNIYPFNHSERQEKVILPDDDKTCYQVLFSIPSCSSFASHFSRSPFVLVVPTSLLSSLSFYSESIQNGFTILPDFFIRALNYKRRKEIGAKTLFPLPPPCLLAPRFATPLPFTILKPLSMKFRSHPDYRVKTVIDIAFSTPVDIDSIVFMTPHLSHPRQLLLRAHCMVTDSCDNVVEQVFDEKMCNLTEKEKKRWIKKQESLSLSSSNLFSHASLPSFFSYCLTLPLNTGVFKIDLSGQGITSHNTGAIQRRCIEVITTRWSIEIIDWYGKEDRAWPKFLLLQTSK